jgi:hypothetical protein
MAHSHAHAEPESTYFLDQLCTIAVCGLLGLTAIGLYSKGWLQTKFGLIDRFHIPVLAGGIALLVLVLLRAISVWRQSGQVRAARYAAALEHGDHEHNEECQHDHGHDEGEKCDHDHGHAHSHSHGHDHAHAHSEANGHDHAHGGGGDEHDHGWAPWQYAVLIIPALLFFLGLPNDGYNMTRLGRDLKESELEGSANTRVALAAIVGGTVIPALKKSGPPQHLRFSELSLHASRQQARELLDGQTVVLEGFFRKSPHSDTEFQLFRVMVNCCQTDSITLKSRIIAPEPLQNVRDMDWVQIEGELTFQKVAGRNEWMPVIEIPSMDKIHKFDQPPADPNKDV